MKALCPTAVLSYRQAVPALAPEAPQPAAAVAEGQAPVKLRGAHRPRSGVLYENCRVEAPDGELLCTCNRSKVRITPTHAPPHTPSPVCAPAPPTRSPRQATPPRHRVHHSSGQCPRLVMLPVPSPRRGAMSHHSCCETALPLVQVEWYLSRGLAERVGDDPPTIRLLFEPAGRRLPGDEYSVTDKENRCVRCGADQDYVRHHVVPQVRADFNHRYNVKTCAEVGGGDRTGRAPRERFLLCLAAVRWLCLTAKAASRRVFHVMSGVPS
jgi:hypothetical protein